MSKRGGRRAVKRKQRIVEEIGPTIEAFDHGDFERAGLAYRRRPVIDVLKERDVITVRQWLALGRYRDLFDQTERSPQRDSCDVGVRGGATDGPTLAVLRAWDERYRLERELGTLREITEAIAGRDWTISEWAIHVGGTKRREKRIKQPATTLRYQGVTFLVAVPDKVETYYEAKTLPLKNATVDIRMAGDWLAAALAA